jgi:putative spermidine/putrescine transport system permease protein
VAAAFRRSRFVLRLRSLAARRRRPNDGIHVTSITSSNEAPAGVGASDPAGTAPPATRRRRLLRLGPGALAAPAVALLLIAFVGPLVVLLGASAGFIVEDTEGHFARFGEVFGDALYRSVLVDSLVMGVTVTACTLVIGYPFAVILARAGGRVRVALIMLLVLPLLTNIVVRTLGWVVLLDDQGLINSILRAVSPSFGLDLLGSKVGKSIALVHVFLPFMIFPVASALEKVSPSVTETAELHGAHPAVRFCRITLPLTAPGIVAGSTLVFLLTMGALVTPLIIGQGRVFVLTTLIYAQIQVGEWARAAALSTVLFFIALLMIVASQVAVQRIVGAPTMTGRRWKPGILNSVVASLSAQARHLPRGATAHRVSRALYLVVIAVFLVTPLIAVVKSAFDTSNVVQLGFSGFTLWSALASSRTTYGSEITRCTRTSRPTLGR